MKKIDGIQFDEWKLLWDWPKLQMKYVGLVNFFNNFSGIGQKLMGLVGIFWDFLGLVGIAGDCWGLLGIGWDWDCGIGF